MSEGNKPPENLIVTIHDVTKEVLQQQKLAAIHQAGQELSDLDGRRAFAKCRSMSVSNC